MSETIIRVEDLSKSYRLGVINHGMLYKDFQSWWARLRGVEDPHGKIEDNYTSMRDGDRFWALNGITFEVARGDVLGIIGRNGAGKSTLLKILSKVTAPTEGVVRIRGRIASLLEVGTGFHPELTGRENVYLNGAILGMTKNEINRKFDEIIEFAEIERFIDTPVKRYSSGMYVRLAFAVAAHLDPEILIVDEVLAVGDVSFQKKCLGKMGDVSKAGRTVLFVSHNMAAVQNLCKKAMLLDSGKIVTSGTTEKVLLEYLSEDVLKITKADLSTNRNRKGTQKVKINSALISDDKGEERRNFAIGESIAFEFSIKSLPGFYEKAIQLAIQLRTSDGTAIANMIDTDSGFNVENFNGSGTYRVIMHDVRLYPDTYFLSFWVGAKGSFETYDHLEDCLSFEIIGGGKLTTRSLPRSAGLVFITPEWIKC